MIVYTINGYFGEGVYHTLIAFTNRCDAVDSAMLLNDWLHNSPNSASLEEYEAWLGLCPYLWATFHSGCNVFVVKKLTLVENTTTNLQDVA